MKVRGSPGKALEIDAQPTQREPWRAVLFKSFLSTFDSRLPSSAFIRKAYGEACRSQISIRPLYAADALYHRLDTYKQLSLFFISSFLSITFALDGRY